jgi:hypothetical protein
MRKPSGLRPASFICAYAEREQARISTELRRSLSFVKFASLLYPLAANKKPPGGGFAHLALLLRGFEQIRTAVGAFAELCLTTRPRNHFKAAAKLRQF